MARRARSSGADAERSIPLHAPLAEDIQFLRRDARKCLARCSASLWAGVGIWGGMWCQRPATDLDGARFFGCSFKWLRTVKIAATHRRHAVWRTHPIFMQTCRHR